MRIGFLRCLLLQICLPCASLYHRRLRWLTRRSGHRLAGARDGPLAPAFARRAPSGLNVWDARLPSGGEPSERAPTAQIPVVLIHFWRLASRAWLSYPSGATWHPRLLAAHAGKSCRSCLSPCRRTRTDMGRFIAMPWRGRAPKTAWFLDVGERLAAVLRRGGAGESLPLPATIWLDSQRVVRQALLGSIQHRRAEVIASTAALIHLAERLAAPPSVLPTIPTEVPMPVIRTSTHAARALRIWSRADALHAAGHPHERGQGPGR